MSKPVTKKKLAKKKPAPPAKQLLPKGYATHTLGFDLTSRDNSYAPFEIEENPPVIGRSAFGITMERIDATLKLLKPGQAFVMPSISINSVRKYLRQTYTSEKFSCTVIQDNPEMMRVFWFLQKKA